MHAEHDLVARFGNAVGLPPARQIDGPGRQRTDAAVDREERVVAGGWQCAVELRHVEHRAAAEAEIAGDVNQSLVRGIRVPIIHRARREHQAAHDGERAWGVAGGERAAAADDQASLGRARAGQVASHGRRAGQVQEAVDRGCRTGQRIVGARQGEDAAVSDVHDAGIVQRAGGGECPAVDNAEIALVVDEGIDRGEGGAGAVENDGALIRRDRRAAGDVERGAGPGDPCAAAEGSAGELRERGADGQRAGFCRNRAKVVEGSVDLAKAADGVAGRLGQRSAAGASLAVAASGQDDRSGSRERLVSTEGERRGPRVVERDRAVIDQAAADRRPVAIRLDILGAGGEGDLIEADAVVIVGVECGAAGKENPAEGRRAPGLEV